MGNLKDAVDSHDFNNYEIQFYGFGNYDGKLAAKLIGFRAT